MYQPQVETWKGDELHAYAALAVTSAANKTTKYGVSLVHGPNRGR